MSSCQGVDFLAVFVSHNGRDVYRLCGYNALVTASSLIQKETFEICFLLSYLCCRKGFYNVNYFTHDSLQQLQKPILKYFHQHFFFPLLSKSSNDWRLEVG